MIKNIQKNRQLFLVVIFILFTLASCDFKPKDGFYTFYTGKEPILELDVTGISGKQLHFEELNFGTTAIMSGSSDTLKSKGYLDYPQGSFVRIYLIQDSIGRGSTNELVNSIYKIIDFNGITIKGNLSEELSLKNVGQTPQDRSFVKYLDSLNYFEKRLISFKTDSLDYAAYLNLDKKINQYIPNFINHQILYPNVKLTALNLAAKKGLLSQLEFSTICSPFMYSNSIEDEFLSQVFDYVLWDLQVLPLNHELNDNILQSQWKNDDFFSKNHLAKNKLKILFEEAVFEKQSNNVELLRRQIEERYGELVDTKIIDFKDLFDRENLFPYGAEDYKILFPRKLPTNRQAEKSKIIILDQNNKVLLNTKTDEYLENQIEGILEYLEKKNPSL